VSLEDVAECDVEFAVARAVRALNLLPAGLDRRVRDRLERDAERGDATIVFTIARKAGGDAAIRVDPFVTRIRRDGKAAAENRREVVSGLRIPAAHRAADRVAIRRRDRACIADVRTRRECTQ